LPDSILSLRDLWDHGTTDTLGQATEALHEVAWCQHWN
jgi:hypothetical protein